jgi:hypothetical protein
VVQSHGAMVRKTWSIGRAPASNRPSESHLVVKRMEILHSGSDKWIRMFTIVTDWRTRPTIESELSKKWVVIYPLLPQIFICFGVQVDPIKLRLDVLPSLLTSRILFAGERKLLLYVCFPKKISTSAVLWRRAAVS